MTCLVLFLQRCAILGAAATVVSLGRLEEEWEFDDDDDDDVMPFGAMVACLDVVVVVVAVAVAAVDFVDALDTNGVNDVNGVK